jgi:predicted ATPase
MKFGAESGMFQELAIKYLGEGPSSPFQIEIVMHGSSTNLIDVGYGVGQVLPVVIDSEVQAQGNILLMQQPEVHLHPRAQAALGSLFARLAATGDRAFVVETHSDYLLDRVRQEVANGVIAPDRVAVLFFDKPALETTIHLIELDELGNLVDPPQGYRDFFLEEELNLLRRGS